MFFIAIFICLLASSQALLDYDYGYLNFWRGFGDVNGDGKADYCRFVCPSLVCLPNQIIMCCHLAGSKNQCGYKSQPDFEAGSITKTAGLFDVNGDGRMDFCRFLVPEDGGDEVPHCRVAGKDGWTEQEVVFNFQPGQEGFINKLKLL